MTYVKAGHTASTERELFNEDVNNIIVYQNTASLSTYVNNMWSSPVVLKVRNLGELTAAGQRGSNETTCTGDSPFRVKPRSLSSGRSRIVRGAVHRCLAEKTDRGPCVEIHAVVNLAALFLASTQHLGGELNCTAQLNMTDVHIWDLLSWQYVHIRMSVCALQFYPKCVLAPDKSLGILKKHTGFSVLCRLLICKQLIMWCVTQPRQLTTII